jgi:hypothetical protein
MHPPPPAWADFSIMMECTSEGGVVVAILCTLCGQANFVASESNHKHSVQVLQDMVSNPPSSPPHTHTVHVYLVTRWSVEL